MSATVAHMQVRLEDFSVDIEAYEISSCIVKPRTLFRYVGLPKAMVERVRAPSCASRLDRVRNVYYMIASFDYALSRGYTFTGRSYIRTRSLSWPARLGHRIHCAPHAWTTFCCSAAGHHAVAACGRRVAALCFALSRTRRARRSPCTAWLLLLLLRAHTQAAMVRILPEEGQGDGARVGLSEGSIHGFRAHHFHVTGAHVVVSSALLRVSSVTVSGRRVRLWPCHLCQTHFHLSDSQRCQRRQGDKMEAPGGKV